MKRFLFSIFALFIPFFIYSQDLIILSNGDRVECKITKEDSTTLYMTVYKHERGINSFISKSEVKSYEYNYNQKLSKIKDSINNAANYKNCITIGLLQGGGSLVGADLEILLTNNIGIQAGAGFVGFGGGLNVHFKPNIRSSFISLQYWHQGAGSSYTQSLMGPNYVFRGKKWFTFQLGLGLALEKGPAYPKTPKQPPMMLMYSLGGYIPW